MPKIFWNSKCLEEAWPGISPIKLNNLEFIKPGVRAGMDTRERRQNGVEGAQLITAGQTRAACPSPLTEPQVFDHLQGDAAQRWSPP